MNRHKFYMTETRAKLQALSNTFRVRVFGFGLCIIASAPSLSLAAEARVLRVCADPNNMPFSNEKGEGFENKIVDVIAKDLDATITYTWWAQRRGYIRNTLKAGTCDLWPGVAAGIKLLATSQPYYRSTYTFVTRASAGAGIDSFDDPRLKTLRVGVQMIGNDAANTPPAHALAARGIINNVRGYMLYGDYTLPNPPAAIVQAVATGQIDVAAVWGPLAGYFAAQQAQPLKVTPIQPDADESNRIMSFDISMGMRKDDNLFIQEINTVLERERTVIDTILTQYHIPRIADPLAMKTREGNL